MPQNYSPEDEAEIFARYAKAQEEGTEITAEMAEEMRDATKGVGEYTKGLNDSLRSLGQSAVTLAKDINSGAQGAGAYKNALSAGVDTFDKWASKFGQLGQIVAGVVDSAASVAVASADQADAIYEQNQKISRAGALGAGGMTEVYENMQKFGYNVNDLTKLTGLLEANSKTLAQFGKGAYDGAKQLADLSETIMQSPLKREFMNMGMTVDEINKGMAGYVKQETMLGASQTMTQDQLRAGTVAYLREMEGLSRLTGQSRSDLEAQRNQALQIDQFAATIANMNRKVAGSGDHLLNAYNQLNKLDPSGSLAKGMAESLNGYISNSKEAQQLWRMTNGENIKWGQELKEGKITEAEYTDRVSKAYLKNAEGVAVMTAAGVETADMFGKMSVITTVAGQGLNDNIQADKDAKKAAADAGAGMNKATAAQTDLRLKQLDATRGLNDLLQNGVGPVTDGMSAIAKLISKIPGMPKMAGSEGGSAETSADQAKKGMFAGSKTTGSSATAYGAGQTGGSYEQVASAPQMNEKGEQTGAPLAQPLEKKAFDALAAKAKEGSALAGKTFEDYEKDKDLQSAALTAATDENRAALKKAGVSTSNAALYLAQLLGNGVDRYHDGVISLLNQPDSTPLNSAGIPASAMKAHKAEWAGLKTAGDLKNWADQKTGGGGYKFGGVASGPTSGYETTLHGTEAIVPLPDGKTIPVDMGMSDSGGDDHVVALLSEQISRMDDMIRVAQNQLTTSKTIAQRVS